MKAIYKPLTRLGFRRDNTWQLPAINDDKLQRAGIVGLKDTKGSAAFRDALTPEVISIAKELAGEAVLDDIHRSPQLLFTFPNADIWEIPYSIWHLDAPRLPDGKAPGIQLFVVLNNLPPGGGGTLVVAGSHRLLNTGARISSKEVRRRLKREPYFASLLSRDSAERNQFLQQAGHVGEIELQVIELTGNTGDVFFMDMRLLHAPTRNCRDVPRIMLTHRFISPALVADYGKVIAD